jgi:hypothetical protein
MATRINGKKRVAKMRLEFLGMGSSKTGSFKVFIVEVGKTG